MLELLKPITWFPPMWAFACGVVSSGASILENWLLLVAGVILAGPLLCATSQVVNDWYDREVDAINEPDRPIPSGRLPGRWGFYIAVAGTLLSLALGAALGTWVLGGNFFLMAQGGIARADRRLPSARIAAARPSSICFWRSSSAARIGGQMNFMQNQTNTIIAIDWPMRVMLIST
mgnify:CR=1 FL=1